MNRKLGLEYKIKQIPFTFLRVIELITNELFFWTKNKSNLFLKIYGQLPSGIEYYIIFIILNSIKLIGKNIIWTDMYI